MWRPVSWFAVHMAWLASAWCRFLLKHFFYLVAFIITFNYKFSGITKHNCSMVYSEVPLRGDSFPCGDRSIGKHCGSIDWFIYSAACSF